MLRIVLVFLAGVLVGANALYYVMTRQRAVPSAPSHPAAVERPAIVDDAKPAPPPAVADGLPAQAAVPAAAAAAVPAVPSPAGLIVPVQGMAVAQLTDTYTATRSEGRTHEAIDIMAPRGTPVLAVADGRVEKLFESKQGGLTLYQFEPSGKFVYYYAHLDRYAPGVIEGRALRQGEVIGYVGSTGNASPDGPHLHFAVFVLGPERQWWKGTPINPYPLLGGR
jgi:murein DD-endopeptidase MepM/ murein hydrolase activator NlpD